MTHSGQTVWVVLGRDLEESGERCLVFVYHGSNLLSDLKRRFINVGNLQQKDSQRGIRAD